MLRVSPLPFVNNRIVRTCEQSFLFSIITLITLLLRRGTFAKIVNDTEHSIIYVQIMHVSLQVDDSKREYTIVESRKRNSDVSSKLAFLADEFNTN